MDYTFGSSLLQFALVPLILISYDICCQWFINLHARITNDWPSEIQSASTKKFIPAIPKMHEPAHGKENHQMYSLNYIPGVGQSDLEAPERIWSPHNALGNSTKTQGPGSRHDVLDDHFNFWNYQKYMTLGKSLAARYKAAVAERNIQVEGHRGLSNTVQPAQVLKWTKVCEEWEEVPFPKTGVKNPYHVVGLGAYLCIHDIWSYSKFSSSHGDASTCSTPPQRRSKTEGRRRVTSRHYAVRLRHAWSRS